MNWCAAWRRVALVMTLSTSPGLLGACISRGSAGALPAPSQLVDVTMRDYRYDFEPPSRPGRAVFRARNAGEVSHELRLLPLSDDIPPIEQQVMGEERREVPAFGRIHPRLPAGQGVFAVDLQPGQRYALVCFVYDRDGEVHARKGMVAEFRTPGQAPGRQGGD